MTDGKIYKDFYRLSHSTYLYKYPYFRSPVNFILFLIVLYHFISYSSLLYLASSAFPFKSYPFIYQHIKIYSYIYILRSKLWGKTKEERKKFQYNYRKPIKEEKKINYLNKKNGKIRLSR